MQNNDGDTALIKASEHVYPSVVNSLLRNKASVDMQNEDGDTALIKTSVLRNKAINASKRRHDRVVDSLLDNKASVDMQNIHGDTALIKASEHGHDWVIRSFLDNKARVDIQNNSGDTALIKASEHGHDRVVDSLLDNKASVDMQNQDGDTALTKASEHGHDRVVRSLLDKKASVDIQNKDGDTALIKASANGSESVVGLLLRYNVQVEKENNDGDTALIKAVYVGQKHVVELLLCHKATTGLQKSSDIAIGRLCEFLGYECRHLTPLIYPVQSKRFLLEYADVLLLSDKIEKNLTVEVLGNVIKLVNPKQVSKEAQIVKIIGEAEKLHLQSNEMVLAKRVIQCHSQDLFKKHQNLNIMTMSPFRSKREGNEIEPGMCIVLYCFCKGFIPLKEDEFPKTLKCGYIEISTDVREGYFEFGPEYETSHSIDYHEKIKMGCGFGIESKKLEGTIGPFLRCENGIGFLTCAHATCGINEYPDGYRYNRATYYTDTGRQTTERLTVLQPPAGMFKRDNQGRELLIGEVSHAVFKPHCQLTHESSIDAAIVKITNESRTPDGGKFAVGLKSNLGSANFKELPLFYGSIIEDPDKLDTDARIVKFGMTSHATRGVLNSDGTVVRTSIAGLRSSDQSGYVSTFINQYEVGSVSTSPVFFMGGDSGSGVFLVSKEGGQETLHLIGLAIGYTSYNSAIVTPIRSILRAFNLHPDVFKLYN